MQSCLVPGALFKITKIVKPLQNSNLRPGPPQPSKGFAVAVQCNILLIFCLLFPPLPLQTTVKACLPEDLTGMKRHDFLGRLIFRPFSIGDVANSKRPLLIITKVQLRLRACALLFYFACRSWQKCFAGKKISDCADAKTDQVLAFCVQIFHLSPIFHMAGHFTKKCFCL